MGNNFLPFNLRLGNKGSSAAKANVSYDGKLRAIPGSMQYGAELEFDGTGTYVDTTAVLSDGDDYTLVGTVVSQLSQYGLIIDQDWGRGLKVAPGQAIQGSLYTVGNVNHEIVSATNYYTLGDVLRLAWVVKNEDNAVLYCNGAYVGEVSISGLTTQSGGNFRIGCDADRLDSLFSGLIANAQIWNHAFTQADATYDYANQLTTADTRTGTDLVRANLIGHWKLDEQWGTVAEDSSDGGHDGTLVGFGDREYPRLRDIGKSPKDNAVVYSGQMLDFDGSDDDVITPYSNSDLVEGFACTVKTTSAISAVSGTAKFISFGAGAYYGMALGAFTGSFSNEVITFYPDGTGAKFSVLSDTLTVTIGIHRIFVFWSEAAATYKIALDGVIYDTSCFGDQSKSSLGYLAFGLIYGAHFNGQLGNIQVWSGNEITADDVAFDYANPELPAHNRPGTSLTAANLKGWWPLIEGSGDCVYDWSGNSNHGTLEGFTHPDCWDNAKALSDPRVFQTAYANWGMGSNLLPLSGQLSTWAARGTASVAETATGPDGAVNSASAVTGVNNDANDVYKVQNLGVTSVRVEPVIWIEQVSTTGVLRISNPVNNYEGEWKVDLASLDNGWVRVTREHTAVTVVNEFVTDANSETGFHFRAVSGGPLAFNIYQCSMVEGTTNTSATTITHATPATNALTPIRSWETANQFTSALNWNGRSYADCGNGVDVNPSTAVIIEMVVSLSERPSASTFILSGKNFSFYSSTADDVIHAVTAFASGNEYTATTTPLIGTGLFHFIYVVDTTTGEITLYLNNVVEGTDTFNAGEVIVTSSNNLIVGSVSSPALFQLPYFRMITDASAQKIIDKDLDAYVAKRYKTVKTRYGLVEE